MASDGDLTFLGLSGEGWQKYPARPIKAKINISRDKGQHGPRKYIQEGGRQDGREGGKEEEREREREEERKETFF